MAWKWCHWVYYTSTKNQPIRAQHLQIIIYIFDWQCGLVYKFFHRRLCKSIHCTWYIIFYASTRVALLACFCTATQKVVPILILKYLYIYTYYRLLEFYQGLFSICHKIRVIFILRGCWLPWEQEWVRLISFICYAFMLSSISQTESLVISQSIIINSPTK